MSASEDDFNDTDDHEHQAGVKPDYSHLSLEQMLTAIQRAHMENILALVEGGEIPNAQMMAQINRFLADNGFTLNGSVPTIDGHANQQPKLPAPPKDRPALPVFEDRYDE